MPLQFTIVDIMKERFYLLGPQLINSIFAKKRFVFESSILDLNSTLESMVERSEQGKWRCTVCGLENDKYKVKRHAEVHLDLTHSCIVCAKNFKTRNALSTHYTRYHTNDVVSPWTNSA